MPASGEPMLKCPICEEPYGAMAGREGRCHSCGAKIGTDPRLRGNDVSSTLSMAWDILKDNFKEIMMLWLIPLGIAIVFSITLILYMSYNIPDDDPAAALSMLATMLTIILPVSIGSVIIQLLFTGGLIGMVKEAFEKGTTKFSTGIATIKRYPLMIIATGVVVQLLVTLGLCLCLIPGLLLCYWWLFALPIVVIEGERLGESLSSSRKFASQNETLGFTIVIFLVVIGISIVGSFINIAITYPTAGVTTEFGTFNIYTLAGNIITALVGALASIYFVIGVSVHYLRGRETNLWWESRIPPPPGHHPHGGSTYRYEEGNIDEWG